MKQYGDAEFRSLGDDIEKKRIDLISETINQHRRIVERHSDPNDRPFVDICFHLILHNSILSFDREETRLSSQKHIQSWSRRL